MIPFENFFRVKTGENVTVIGSGAWEIAARISYINLTDGEVLGGALCDFTAGLNWYLTPYHRVKLNYIRANLDRNATDSVTDIFGIRFDTDF